MAIYRVDAYLSAAIQSILQQTFSDFELLIVLDTRSHDMRDTILSLCVGDSRVKLLESPPLGGLALALNLGIAAARGEYVARMDGDDICLPDRLATQVRYMDDHPDVAVLGCKIQMIDEDGTKVARPYPFYETDRQIRDVLPLRNPMPHPALMYRKSVLLAIGGYKYAHSGEDWELFIRIARDKNRKFHNLDRVLFEYRRHAAQGTRPDLMRAVFLEAAAFLFSEFLRTGSPKYLLGMLLKFPPLLKTRNALRKLAGDRVS
jgi:glycosyltransferase involved in cell wall biosynthesis